MVTDFVMFFNKQKDKLELGKYGRFGLSKFCVEQSERYTHTYVIGITGTGKSKFLEHILFQDIIQGKGCGVLDPHSDLISDLFKYLQSYPKLSQQHLDRIIYFDPSRTDYLIPFNVLNSDFTPYETTQNVIEAFRRTWPKTLQEAPRFANIATAALLTLIANNLSLVEMPKLLTDKEFREQLLQNVINEEVILFWRNRYEKWGREAPLMIESILNKVSAFILNPQLRLILGANENRLNFQKIMDEEKVLLVDLGRCDAETRRLVGSLIVTGSEQSARARKFTIKSERKPFFFCIDEFQDFCSNDGATQSLTQILSECRKFGLYLTLAHQTLSQVNERMKGALGNTRLKINFCVSRRDAEILAKHLFQVSGVKVKQKTKAISGNPTYYTLSEEWEKLIQQIQNLPSRRAFVNCGSLIQSKKIATITIQYKKIEQASLEQIQQILSEKMGISVHCLNQSINQRSASAENSSNAASSSSPPLFEIVNQK